MHFKTMKCIYQHQDLLQVLHMSHMNLECCVQLRIFEPGQAAVLQQLLLDVPQKAEYSVLPQSHD